MREIKTNLRVSINKKSLVCLTVLNSSATRTGERETFILRLYLIQNIIVITTSAISSDNQLRVPRVFVFHLQKIKITIQKPIFTLIWIYLNFPVPSISTSGISSILLDIVEKKQELLEKLLEFKAKQTRIIFCFFLDTKIFPVSGFSVCIQLWIRPPMALTKGIIFKRLQSAKNFQQNVETMSAWILHHVKYISTISRVWFDVYVGGKNFITLYINSFTFLIPYT